MVLQRPNCLTKIFLQGNSLRHSICLLLCLTEELKGIKTGPLLICGPTYADIHLCPSLACWTGAQERHLEAIKRTCEHGKCGLFPTTLQSLLCSVTERR